MTEAANAIREIRADIDLYLVVFEEVGEGHIAAIVVDEAMSCKRC